MSILIEFYGYFKNCGKIHLTAETAVVTHESVMKSI